MKRIEVLTGTCLALLGALSAAEYYYDNQKVSFVPKPKEIVAHESETREPPHATTLVSADEVVSTYLSGLKEGPEIERSVAVASLMDRLESPEYEKSVLSPSSSKLFIEAAQIVIDETKSEEPESVNLKSRIAEFVGTRLQGRAAYGKVVELGAAGLIPQDKLPGMMRRTGGRKSVEGIASIMKSTDNPKIISACAVALQDFRDPKLFGEVLERLDQTGMIDHPSQLPWISGKLLSEYVETAEATGLSRGAKVLRTRPSLTKDLVASLDRILEKGEEPTKQIAVEAVRKALVANVIPAEQGEKLLSGRTQTEGQAVLKAALPVKEDVKAQ